MRAARCFAKLLCGACSLTACTFTPPVDAPREWIEVTGGVAFIDERSPDAVDDAFGWRLGGGYDLNFDAVRASWELDIQWASHDYAGQLDGESNLSAWIIGTGLRLTARLDPLPFSAYVRSGVAWRQESVRSDTLLEQDESGEYFGCGLEWRPPSGGSLGPAIVWFRGDEGVRTRFAGLSARFSY